MQILYAFDKDKGSSVKESEKTYQDRVDISFQLYMLNVLHIAEVSKYVVEDQERRKGKHLPTDLDKQFNTLLYENDIVQTFVNSEGFQSKIKKLKLSRYSDKDLNQKFYKEFSKTDDFRNYIMTNDKGDEDHRDVLLKLYKFLVKHELYNEQMEDFSPTWQDDKSLVIGTMKKTIKAVSGDADFYSQYRPDDETVQDFGADLLHKCLIFNDDHLEIIRPKLKNWEADRVASVDMILLKMAICEFMHFPTIPTKVTLNEYVDISKLYSTPKSKEFINGILDKLMKELHQEGKINKEGRGLQE
ncbi:MAG: transcription antitermination factor NusB [Bacteroidota bacterium]